MNSYIFILLSLLIATYRVLSFDVVILPTPPPEGLQVSLGDSLLLTCYVNGSTSTIPQLRWIGPNGLEISTTDRKQNVWIETEMTDKTKLKLHLNSIFQINAGAYVCRYTVEAPPGSSMQPVSASINVVIRQRIQIQDCVPYQYTRVDQPGYIRCVLSGVPAPTIKWFFTPMAPNGDFYNDSLIPITNDGHRVLTQQGLEFQPAYTSDQGYYRVVAEIESTGDAKEITIQFMIDTPASIIFGPDFKPPYTKAIDSRDVFLICNAGGTPQPSVRWFRQKYPDVELSSQPKYYENYMGGTLQVKDLNFDDSDTYKCCAVNRVSQVCATKYIQVFEIPRVQGYPNITARRGDPAELVCDMRGTFPMRVYFRKLGDPFQPPNPTPYVDGPQPGDPRIVQSWAVHPINPQQITARLTFNFTTDNDTANYSCIAENEGYKFEQNGTLSVVFGATLNKQLKTTYYGYSSNTTNLTCIAWGLANLQFRWYRREAEIYNGVNDTFYAFTAPNARYTVGFLQIKVRYRDQIWIYDTYRCRAINDLGHDDMIFNFWQTFPPGPPNITIVETSPTDIVLHLTAPPPTDGNAFITFYQILYRADGETFRPAIWYPIDEDVKVSFLSPSTRYEISVSSVSLVGPGVPIVFFYYTATARRPFVPTIFSPYWSQYPFMYNVRWHVSSSGGSAITQYIVRFRQVQLDLVAGGPNSTKILTSGEWRELRIYALPLMNEYLVRRLDANCSYQLELLAQNIIGYSDPDSIIFRTPDSNGLPPPEAVMQLALTHHAQPFLLALLITLTILLLIGEHR